MEGYNIKEIQRILDKHHENERRISTKLDGEAELIHGGLTEIIENIYPGLKREAYHATIDIGGKMLLVDGKSHPLINTLYVSTLNHAMKRANQNSTRSAIKNLKNVLAHEYGHVLEEEFLWPFVEEKLGDKHDLFEISPLFISEGFAHWFGNFFSNYAARVSERTFDVYTPLLRPSEAIQAYKEFEKYFGSSLKNLRKEPTVDALREQFVKLSKTYGQKI